MGILMILGKHQYLKWTQVGGNIICQPESFFLMPFLPLKIGIRMFCRKTTSAIF